MRALLTLALFAFPLSGCGVLQLLRPQEETAKSCQASAKRCVRYSGCARYNSRGREDRCVEYKTTYEVLDPGAPVPHNSTLVEKAKRAPVDRPIGERVTDGLGLGLLSAVSAVAGTFAGGLVGYAVCDDNLYCPLVGGGIGLLGGFIGGAYLFDGLSDGDGSLWAARIGTEIGVGLAFLAFATLDPSDPGAAVYLIPLLIPAGAGLGYALFDSPPALPSVAVLPDGQGGTQFSAALGGTF